MLGIFDGGVGQASSAGHPYRGTRDECNFFGDPSDSVVGRVLGRGVAFDRSQCVNSAVGSCISFRRRIFGCSAINRACMSISLSFIVVVVVVLILFSLFSCVAVFGRLLLRAGVVWAPPFFFTDAVLVRRFGSRTMVV